MAAAPPLAQPDRDGLVNPFAKRRHVALRLPATVAFYRGVLGSEAA